eukprot:15485159-Alexandrium_andersonii.AAC.1
MLKSHVDDVQHRSSRDDPAKSVNARGIESVVRKKPELEAKIDVATQGSEPYDGQPRKHTSPAECEVTRKRELVRASSRAS